MQGEEERAGEKENKEHAEHFSKDRFIVRQIQKKQIRFYGKQEAQVNRTMGRNPNKKYGY